MAGTAPTLELEALFVRIYANAEQLFATTKKVETEVARMASMVDKALAGMVAGAIYAFARFDDAVTRSLAHMRKFSEDTFSSLRMDIEKGLFDTASRSVTGVTDLAKGFDILVSSGQSAGMALKSLEIAETFAVASGMKLTDATQGLIDIQRGLGLAVEDAASNYKVMNMMADTFVGISRKVGGTEQQMTQAFTGRLMATMSQFKVSFQDAAALVGAASTLGKDFRGAHGGMMLERTLRQLSDVSNIPAREKQFGFEAFDKAGKLRSPIELLNDLGGRFSGLSEKAIKANLTIMGFRDTVRDTIVPFIQVGGVAATLRKEIESLGGISEMTAEMMRRSLSGQLKNLWNNVQTLAVAIGKYLAPTIGYLAAALRAVTQAFTSLNPAFQSFIVLWVSSTVLSRFNLISTAFTVIKATIGTLISPLTALVSLIWNFASSSYRAVMRVVDAFLDLGRAIWSGLIGMLQLAFSSLINFFIFLPSILLFLPGLFAAAAIGVTIFMAATRHLSDTWESFSMKLPNMMKTAAEGLADTGRVAVNIWEVAKVTAAEYFDSVIAGISKTAGFFWHFGENVKTIFAFMAKNYSAVAEDIGAATVALVENTAANFVQLATAIYKIGDVVFKTFFLSIFEYGGFALSWLKISWRNIFDDMGVVIKGFFHALLVNFKLMLDGMARITVHSDFMDVWGTFLGKAWITVTAKSSKDLEDRFKKLEEERAEKWKKINEETTPEGILKNFKAPQDFINTSHFKTKWGTLWSFLDTATGNIMGSFFPKAGKDISKIWGGLGFKSPLAGFEGKAPWGDLKDAVKTDLPTGFADKLLETFNKMMGQPGAAGEAGQLRGTHGPGFQFRQISEARFQVGGPAYETVEYQQLQVLHQMNNHLAAIEAANRGKPPYEMLPMPSVLKE